MKVIKTYLLICCLLTLLPIEGQEVIRFDLDRKFPIPEEGRLRMGDAGPAGKEIRINSRYMTEGGKPVLPVMGELHFSRIRPELWENVILKMKAGGVTVISTYLFWNQHEEIEGQFDWEGEKNLRSFLKLCAAHDMQVVVRMGPWSHGEARNGGTPDWILRKRYIRERSEDVVYQAYVERYFGEIARQLEGLLYKDGGPVIGIQLENEYWYGKDGESYISRLKKLTLALDIDVPLYTVTGWGNGSVPPFEVIPLWGAYPDAPWVENTEKLLQPGNYQFDDFRDNRNIGNDRKEGDTYMTYDSYPYFTCEVGAGVQNTWHRRTVIPPIDGLAIMTAKLGSGSNMLGYYMFAGGTQFRGVLHSTEEEQDETGYWSRVPMKSYDFQAPIRESGEVSEAFRKIKGLHYFVNGEQEKLAGMNTVLYQGNSNALQFSVRCNGDEAFLFGINYARFIPKKTIQNCRFELKFRNETVCFPSQGIDIPDSSVFIWPVNYHMEKLTLKYASAQLTGVLGDTRFLTQTRDIPVELAFDRNEVSEVSGVPCRTDRSGKYLIVSEIIPGRDCVLNIQATDGSVTRFVILTEKETEMLWFPDGINSVECFLSHDPVYSDGRNTYVETSKDELTLYRFGWNETDSFQPVRVSPPFPVSPGISCSAEPVLNQAHWLETAVRSIPTSDRLRYHRFFFKEFSLDNPAEIRKAVLYLFAETPCRIGVNGRWVNQQPDTGMVNQLDLTAYLAHGENRLVLDFPYIGGSKAFAARLDVLYSNYDRIGIVSGPSWLTADGYMLPTDLKPSEYHPAAPQPGVVPEIAIGAEIAGMREYRIKVPDTVMDSVYNILLRISYHGDRAELYNGHVLVADNFNSNTPWTIALNRLERTASGNELSLILYGLDPQSQVYFDNPPDREEFADPVLTGFSAIPVYRIKID